MLNVGLVFGGVSPEHEVSIITALQVAAALDRERYRPVPVYIAKNGAWYTGERLLQLDLYKDLEALIQSAAPAHLEQADKGKIALASTVPKGWLGEKVQRTILDVLFLALHGSEGENGGLQGLCETFNIPYTGSGVMGSALGMDKVLSKMICRDQGIPIVPFWTVTESVWAGREEFWLDQCEEALGFPVIVKPARLGSSIGIAKAGDRAALDAAIEEAFRYDEKIVVEYAVRNLREINCSVLGDVEEAIASVLEEPVTGEELLSYQEKYMRGAGERGAKTSGAKAEALSSSEGMASLDRIIPAPVTDEQAKVIQELGVRVFQLFECAGLARIDFLMDGETGDIYFNEINTIPGSFSFYLWGPSGIPFDELTHRLIELAFKRYRERNRRIRSYDVNLLAMRSSGGAKGAKT